MSPLVALRCGGMLAGFRARWRLRSGTRVTRRLVAVTGGFREWLCLRSSPSYGGPVIKATAPKGSRCGAPVPRSERFPKTRSLTKPDPTQY